MDMTETFTEVEQRILKKVPLLQKASSGEFNPLDIARVSEELSSSNQTFERCRKVLVQQLEASGRAAAALKVLTDALEQLMKNILGSHGNFTGTGGSGGRLVWVPRKDADADHLQALQQLSDGLKESLTLLETLQATLADTIKNSQEGSNLSGAAKDAIDRQIQEEERRRQEEEDEQKRLEEERKRREERMRQSEKERMRRDEERRRLEEVERKKKEEEEERKRKAEEERKRLEENERMRREEEERKRSEEEERRIREEEESLRREEEERKKLEEEERHRIEVEKRRKRELRRQAKRAEEERRRREAEAKQQQEDEEQLLREEEESWKPKTVPVRDSKLDSEHGCAIRAPTGAFISEEFRCTTAPELIRGDSFPPSEEVVGNAIRLEAIGRSELGSRFRDRRVEWFVSLPHGAQRVHGRETVLYAHKNDTWQELTTDEIHSDTLPSEHRWVETRISEPSMILVPVNRWKINRFSLTRQGVELASQADSRIRLSIPPDSFSPLTATLDQTFEVRPVPVSVVDDLRSLHPDQFSGVIATSSIVIHGSSVSRSVKPQVVYTLHLPRNGNSNGLRAASQSTAGSKSKPAETGSDITIIANCDTRATNPKWNAMEMLDGEEATAREKQMIRISNLSSRRLLALRVAKDFDVSQLDFVCRELEHSLVTRTACLIVGQSADSRQAIVALPSKENVQDVLDAIKANGFSRVTTRQEDSDVQLKVMERQQLHIELTGNVSSDKGEEFPVQFHSQAKDLLLLTLSPKDPYQQKMLDRYRGFVQAFSEHQPTRVAKVSLQLDKLASDRSGQPAWKSPFKFKPRDAVTKECLQYLAKEVQDSWSILADRLGMSKERCSVIRNSGRDSADQTLDMLIDWLKGTPHSANKVAILASALRATGYNQLAVDLLKEQRRLIEANEVDNE